MELQHLTDFGDFIGIDPTFPPMTSDSSTITIIVPSLQKASKSG